MALDVAQLPTLTPLPMREDICVPFVERLEVTFRINPVVVKFRECVWVSMMLFENAGPLKDVTSLENTEELGTGPTTLQMDISKSRHWPGHLAQ